jgi:6-phosphogluconolactonase
LIDPPAAAYHGVSRPRVSIIPIERIVMNLRTLSARLLAALSLLTATFLLPAAAGAAEEMLVYAGTYTGGKSEGIYIFRLDQKSGAMEPRGVAKGVSNPSFLALAPSGRFIYAACEVAEFAGEKSGAIAAFAIDEKTGALALINQQPSGGGGPCHLVVDRAGRNVLVANYGGGSVSVLRIEEDGRLGRASAFVQHEGSSVNPQRQARPHAHSINLDAANRFAFAADLGLDKVLIYRFAAERGTLEAAEQPFAALAPGSGPRHFAFHPAGRHAYVINEMASTVTAFTYDAPRGALAELQTLSTLPEGFSGRNSTAEVQVAPSGKFLYGSNRGHDSIAVFAIDLEKGTLAPVEHKPTGGKTPRNFGIDPTGTFLLAANQGSDSIVVFRIDGATGRLEATGEAASVPTPVCVKFLERRGG